MKVTIVGGGLTGLTAAYYLGHAKPDWQIQLYEQAPRFGGKIQTQQVDDFVVELGPDSYLGRKTEMTDLITDLGLADTLVSNETVRPMCMTVATFTQFQVVPSWAFLRK